MFKKPETTSLIPPLYKRRKQTISLAALYEMKLISLLYLRASLDDTIEEFQLAANVDQMYLFDDICFKVKVKEFDNPIEVFIEVKNREKNYQGNKNYLKHLFYGYLKIREQFESCNDDLFFEGKFNETECFFVLYTNAIIKFPPATRGSCDSAISVKLKDLIDTGGTYERINLQEEHVHFLCQESMKNQMISVAKRIAKLLDNDGNFQTLLTDESMLIYHVILAQKVVKVSEIHPDGHRIASFRREFFDTEEKYLIIFKDTLIKEVQNKQEIKSTDQNILVTELLSTLHFKVPIAFGNIDLVMRGNDAKIEKRINYLASRIYNIIAYDKTSDKSTIVTIDDSLPEGFFQQNGGVAGAIGNIFVLDDNTKLIKITDKTEQLEPLAKKLYTKLKEMIPNLHELKFNFKVKKFPKLSFDFSQYEENLVTDFLNRLVLYHNQADLNTMDAILNKLIEDQLEFNKAESEVTFLRFSDQIHKWMMVTNNVAPVLTRKNNLLKINDTLITQLNANYMREMKLYNYTFTQLALRSLKLEKLSNTIIITENSILTVVKVIQHLKDKAHLVLNFENIQINDLTALRRELKFTNHDKVLILVCDEIQKEKINALEIFTVRNGNMIIVTNRRTYKTVEKYFKADSILHDKKLSLIDLSEESQMNIFETATVIFPGVEEEIQLDLLLQGWPKPASSGVRDPIKISSPITSVTAGACSDTVRSVRRTRSNSDITVIESTESLWTPTDTDESNESFIIDLKTYREAQTTVLQALAGRQTKKPDIPASLAGNLGKKAGNT